MRDSLRAAGGVVGAELLASDYSAGASGTFELIVIRQRSYSAELTDCIRSCRPGQPVHNAADLAQAIMMQLASHYASSIVIRLDTSSPLVTLSPFAYLLAAMAAAASPSALSSSPPRSSRSCWGWSVLW